jgi:hypothetical protein
MDFLKKNWPMIAFGVVMAASIGMGVWGWLRGDEIKKRMTVPEQIAQRMPTYSGTGANPEMIEQKKAQIERDKKRFEEAIAAGLNLQRYSAFEEETGPDGKVVRKKREPIVADALPKPLKPGDAYRFRDQYKLEIERMIKRLNGGSPPTHADIDDMRFQMSSRKPTRTKANEDPWALAEAAAFERVNPAKAERPTNRADALRQDPEFVAALERAKRIWIYVDDKAIGVHALADKDLPAPPDEIWQAQLSLWIQQDVVTALARVNEREAAALAKSGKTDHQWVAYMPVKELIKIAIAARLGRGGGFHLQSTQFAPSFTRRNNTAGMFMVPVQLVVVADVRKIPELLAELTRTNFMTPINVEIASIPSDPLQKPYVFGPNPVAKVTIDLELYFLRSEFEKFIPDELKQALASPDARDVSRTGRE